MFDIPYSILFKKYHLFETVEVSTEILALGTIHFVEIADLDDKFQFLLQKRLVLVVLLKPFLLLLDTSYVSYYKLLLLPCLTDLD